MNELLGTDTRERVNAGEVVKAIILNGLGFVSKPNGIGSINWGSGEKLEDNAIRANASDFKRADYIALVEVPIVRNRRFGRSAIA